MKERMFITPECTTANEIKKVRKQLGLTQKEFAELINCSKSTVERWEMSEEPISGLIVSFLKILEKHPQYVDEIRIPKKVYPLRLKYMHQNQVCTVIDVDEMRRKVQIINYTDNLMFRAFGKDETPSYEAYEEFLESRCFPRSRDKLKLILEDLNLPFYDPLMIIEKTEGKMAEDYFWIRIER